MIITLWQPVMSWGGICSKGICEHTSPYEQLFFSREEALEHLMNHEEWAGFFKNPEDSEWDGLYIEIEERTVDTKKGNQTDA